jgi:hypothetical protein
MKLAILDPAEVIGHSWLTKRLAILEPAEVTGHNLAHKELATLEPAQVIDHSWLTRRPCHPVANRNYRPQSGSQGGWPSWSQQK